MKKILTILMFVVVLSLLVGCGAKQAATPAQTAEDVEVASIGSDIEEIDNLDIDADLAELDDLDKELADLI